MQHPAAETLGDYLKKIEAAETGRRPAPGHAAYVRVDGNRFSKFTRGMERPYDKRLSWAMRATTIDLVDAFGAILGYTQSDEISLVLWYPNPDSEMAHAGKFQKLASRTASKTTACFYRRATEEYGLKEYVARQFPEFDSRAFGLPLEDAAKAILWREIDARKNSVSMAAQHYFSHKSLQGKNTDDMIAMLAEKGVDFESYPNSFKYGTYIKRVKRVRELTDWEMAKIPPKHRPSGPIERTDIEEVPIAPLRSYEPEKRLGILFGENPDRKQ